MKLAYLLLSQKVSDLNVVLVVSNAGVNGEMGVHKPHLVAISLGHSSDQVVDMADGGPDGGRCLPGSEPRIHLQLSAALQHLEVEVQVLEVASEHSSRPCNPNLLGLDLDLDPRWEVHSLR